MSPGFKIVVAIVLLIGLPGLYILNKGPNTDLSEEEQAKINARMGKKAKKSEGAESAPAADGAATPTASPTDSTVTDSTATDPAAQAPVAAMDPNAAPTTTDAGPAPASVSETPVTDPATPPATEQPAATTTP